MKKIQAMMHYAYAAAIVAGSLLVVLALPGCASSPVPAVVRVEVPVPVKCVIKAPDVPHYAVDDLPIGADIWNKMAALRADRITRKAYEAELEAAINSCQ